MTLSTRPISIVRLTQILYEIGDQMRQTLLSVFLCFFTLTTFVTGQNVALKNNKESIKATIGGDVFAVFRFDENRKKPFVLPVTGPGGYELLKNAKPTDQVGAAGRRVIIADPTPQLRMGTFDFKIGDVLSVGKIEGDWLEVPLHKLWIHRSDVAPMAATVTRQINDNPPKVKDRKDPLYYDHPHHKGIWLSVDEINGIKFWNEDGRIKNVSREIIKPTGNPAVLKTVNHWVNEDGVPLLREDTLIKIYKNRLMTYEVTFSAEHVVEIGDTKEGMFAIRLTNSMREMVAGGPVINADGASGTSAAWGKPSNWVDYKGPIDSTIFGVTLMDHPENPWKSRYHVRNYGLFAVNPFGAGAYTKGDDVKAVAHHRVLKPKGERLSFKYGIYIHGGMTTEDEINQVYKQFATKK